MTHPWLWGDDDPFLLPFGGFASLDRGDLSWSVVFVERTSRFFYVVPPRGPS